MWGENQRHWSRRHCRAGRSKLIRGVTAFDNMGFSLEESCDTVPCGRARTDDAQSEKKKARKTEKENASEEKTRKQGWGVVLSSQSSRQWCRK